MFDIIRRIGRSASPGQRRNTACGKADAGLRLGGGQTTVVGSMKTRWYMRPEFADALRAAGLTDLDAVFAADGGARLDKPSLEKWRQRWRIELPSAVSSRSPACVYLKRFNAPPLVRQFQRWREGHWRRSTAGVEEHNASLLAEAGIRAARPIGFGEEMCGPWERRSFLLLDEVPGLSLERWAPQAAAHSGRQRRACVDVLARFIAGFHAAGFVHRDLYLSHVFITRPPEPDSPAVDRPEFALIDLQRVFRPRWRRLRWVVKDLAALDYSTPHACVSRLGRLRFLARYVRVFPRWPVRTLAARIAARRARFDGAS